MLAREITGCAWTFRAKGEACLMHTSDGDVKKERSLANQSKGKPDCDVFILGEECIRSDCENSLYVEESARSS